MKKIILITLLLPIVAFSQKISSIDYGNSYSEIKEMSVYDFNDNCKTYPKIVNVFGDYTASTGKYANSIFYKYLKLKNRKLADKYNNELLVLGDDFSYSSNRKLYRDYDGCTEKGYNFMQLYISKFEIISNYYKNLYNYDLDKKQEKIAIKIGLQKIADSIHSAKSQQMISHPSNNINNDKRLLSLIDERDREIKSMKKGYNDKIELLEMDKKSEISNLSVSNYSANKEKINSVYAAKIQLIKDDKNQKISALKKSWNNKINKKSDNLKGTLNEEKEMNAMKNNNVVTTLEEEKNIKQNQFRKAIKSKNQLNKKREEIEKKYKMDISKINIEIDIFLQ